MMKVCVCGFCSKTTKDGISLFGFPKDAELRRNWTAFVRRTREWSGNFLWSLGMLRLLDRQTHCDDSFEEKPGLIQSMGMTVRCHRVLRPKTVPTLVVNKPCPQPWSSEIMPETTETPPPPSYEEGCREKESQKGECLQLYTVPYTRLKLIFGLQHQNETNYRG